MQNYIILLLLSSICIFLMGKFDKKLNPATFVYKKSSDFETLHR